MKKLSFIMLLGFWVMSCSTSKYTSAETSVQVSFVQINDVYEIDALEGGTSGGMARVATLKNQVLAENPNTLLVMAGDFLSPSVYNSLKVDGTPVRGKQMVEAMNAAGMDIAVFGNHEFDIRESELKDRINESTFEWISGNTFNNISNVVTPFSKVINGKAYPFPKYLIRTFKNDQGHSIKLGFISVCLPFNKSSYVVYTDPLSTAEMLYHQIKDSCDAVVAITHQAMEDDIELAKRLPELALIMGGHEHDMRLQRVGKVWITKAHANSKSAFINQLRIVRKQTQTKEVEVTHELKYLDASVEKHTYTQEVVQKWSAKAAKNFASLGFDAQRIILEKGEELEGRESYVRSTTTNLTKLVIRSMEYAAPQADVAIVNSGSIRVDDVLKMPLTEYDIIRTLPYGGAITEVEMKGSLLRQVLDIGVQNRGIGGFLQYSESLKNLDGQWTISEVLIQDTSSYRVALTEFLLTGGEANLGFLKPNHPGITEVYPLSNSQFDPRSDIRLAIIRYISKEK
ncbi:MAG: bifunctional metallophosphatase/5'-nucleotidase [Ferruginibacter sp.]|nr:bifunctional metallophosphatase/5'-nucleotidase [Ferruginibacter sp.]